MKSAARQIRDAQVAAVYESNQSLRSTAKLFGISHEGVRKILSAQGVEIAPPCTWNNPVGPAPLASNRPVGVIPSAHRAPLSPLAVPSVSSVERPGRSHSLPTGAN
tara:strand:- start:2453 stop:2770 length:318 start_codon:yes stop_codon:yes gene_type:complete